MTLKVLIPKYTVYKIKTTPSATNIYAIKILGVLLKTRKALIPKLMTKGERIKSPSNKSNLLTPDSFVFGLSIGGIVFNSFSNTSVLI